MDVIITLDYELFLGEKTGSVENCLIKPMSDLCKIADKYGFKYVIFADAAYLLRLTQLKGKDTFLDECYEKTANNLRMLSEKGHEIELHFHPQWLYSKWDGNSKTWEMDRTHYKLSDMPAEDLNLYFPSAKKLLEHIIGDDKKIIAFRAGGFCLSPFSPFEKMFDENEIFIDSSVARKSFVKSSVHRYDYRHIPKDIVYSFKEDICKKDTSGKRIEVSISSNKWRSLTYMLKIRKKLQSFKPNFAYRDGASIVDHPNRSTINKRLRKLFTSYTALASIDTETSMLLFEIFEKAKSHSEQTFVAIGHPKNVTDLSLHNFEEFIAKVYKDNRIITITELQEDFNC